MMCDNSCTKINNTIFFLYILDLLLYQRAPKICNGEKYVHFIESVYVHFIESVYRADGIIWNSRRFDNSGYLFCNCKCDLGELL